jgi:hypothetical protein
MQGKQSLISDGRGEFGSSYIESTMTVFFGERKLALNIVKKPYDKKPLLTVGNTPLAHKIPDL